MSLKIKDSPTPIPTHCAPGGNPKPRYKKYFLNKQIEDFTKSIPASSGKKLPFL